MADNTPDAPAPAPDETKPFVYKAPVNWCLTGAPRSPALDFAVDFAVSLGYQVETDRPGLYRTLGPVELNATMETGLAFFRLADIGFAPERPPARPSLSFDLAPERLPVRSAQINAAGDAAARMVARAIDAGLRVRRVGLGRYIAIGQTRLHIAWVMDLYERNRAQALEILGITAEQALAEDTAAPPVAVKVSLPERKTVSEITRDREGSIVSVTQLEKSV